MKKLLLLLPLYLFSASENDTCYSNFTIPNINQDQNDLKFIHICIDGYSYIYDNKNGKSLVQNFMLIDNKTTIPVVCDCEVMKLMDQVKK